MSSAGFAMRATRSTSACGAQRQTATSRHAAVTAPAANGSRGTGGPPHTRMAWGVNGMRNRFADRWAVIQNGGTAGNEDGDIVSPDDIQDESPEENQQDRGAGVTVTLAPCLYVALSHHAQPCVRAE